MKQEEQKASDLLDLTVSSNASDRNGVAKAVHLYSVVFNDNQMIVTYKDVNTLASLRCKQLNNGIDGYN